MFRRNRAILPEDSFPNLRKCARGMISILGCTCSCEQTFSKIKYVKTKRTNDLCDGHLRVRPLVEKTKFDPYYRRFPKNQAMIQTSRSATVTYSNETICSFVKLCSKIKKKILIYRQFHNVCYRSLKKKIAETYLRVKIIKYLGQNVFFMMYEVC